MNKITIQPNSGLCNRLRVLFSWLKIAKDNNCILEVYWNIDDHCNGHFLEVFEAIPGVIFIKKTPSKVDYYGCYQHKDIDLTKALYSDLIPKKQILSKIQDFTDRYKKFNAVHIRRTDYLKLAERKKIAVSNYDYERFISESEYPIYISCDNKDTQDYFLDFSTKTFIKNKIINSKQRRQTSLEHAVFDMFVCCRSIKFLGTNSSTFSDLIYMLKQDAPIPLCLK